MTDRLNGGGRLRLMWDYDAFPLWNSPENDPPVIIEYLPLSPGLRHALQAWSDTATERHAPSGPTTLRIRPARGDWEAPWDTGGRQLWPRLRDELGPDYEVGYYNERRPRAASLPSFSRSRTPPCRPGDRRRTQASPVPWCT